MATPTMKPMTTVVPKEIGMPVFFTYHQTVAVLKSLLLAPKSRFT